MSGALKLYQSLLRKYPFYVHVCQTGCLMGSGDVLAQKIVERKTWKQYSFGRTMSFVTVGTFLVGPVLSNWYKFLHKQFGNQKYGVLMKVAVDQSCMAPTLIASIITSLGLLQTRPLSEIKHQLTYDYKEILKTNYKVWPFVQLANFYLVPLNYQILTVQTVSLVWNTYLSWKIGINEAVETSETAIK